MPNRLLAAAIVGLLGCTACSAAASPRPAARSQPARSVAPVAINPYIVPRLTTDWWWYWHNVPRPGMGLAQQDFYLQASDDTKIRIMDPPTQFDAKGNPKKLTKEELKELKGRDTKLAGYEADFESLKKNQFIHVYLIKEKNAPNSQTTNQSTGSGKNKTLPDGELVGQLIRMNAATKEFVLRIKFPVVGRSRTLPPYPKGAGDKKDDTTFKKPLVSKMVILSDKDFKGTVAQQDKKP